MALNFSESSGSFLNSVEEKEQGGRDQVRNVREG